MALPPNTANALVNTYTSGGVPKLVNQPASISKPTTKDAWPAGGILRYVLQLDDSADIAAGDFVQIAAYGNFPLDPNKRYLVFSAAMDGGLGYEVWHVLMGDKVQR